MNIPTFVSAALLADMGRDAVPPTVVRVSRMEAILADVFEKGLSAMAPLALSGQGFQRAVPH